jgi:hypothetical protein
VGLGLALGRGGDSPAAATKLGSGAARAVPAFDAPNLRVRRPWLRHILFATMLIAAAMFGASIALAFSSPAHRQSAYRPAPARREASHPAVAHSSTPSAGTVTVAATTHARRLPNGFLGLSFEYRGLEEYLGTNPAALDPPFLQLVRNLAPGQSPVVRIGGDSTDWTWWPVPGIRRPGGVKYSLDPRWASVARAFADAVDARLILGVNFEADSRAIARGMAAGMVRGIGSRSVAALELGNEPELYASFNWYRAPDGKGVRGRAAGYNFSSYVRDYASVAGDLPGVPLAGPSSGAQSYLAYLSQFLGLERRVGMVTTHAYPLKHCVPSEHPTDAQLLDPSTARALTSQLAAYVAVASTHHRPLRVDEMNSVSCGGYGPVTETFGPALWSLEQLFQLDAAGVGGVNFDTVPNTLQHLIAASRVHGHWITTVEPEYYGLLAFAQAAPAGSRLASVTGSLPANLSAFATLATGGATHVVLINTGSAPASIRLSLAGSPGTLNVTRLLAPSVAATGSVTLGGQSINPGTGMLTGTSNVTQLVASSSGAYQVTVAGDSAVIISNQ